MSTSSTTLSRLESLSRDIEVGDIKPKVRVKMSKTLSVDNQRMRVRQKRWWGSPFQCKASPLCLLKTFSFIFCFGKEVIVLRLRACTVLYQAINHQFSKFFLKQSFFLEYRIYKTGKLWCLKLELQKKNPLSNGRKDFKNVFLFSFFETNASELFILFLDCATFRFVLYICTFLTNIQKVQYLPDKPAH